MTFSKRCLFISISFFLCAKSYAVSPQGWTKYSNDNFIVYANDDEKQVTEILKEFEVFRAVTYDMLQLDKSKNLVPVKIFLFQNEQDFAPFKFSKNLGGYFQNPLSGPRMIVGHDQYGKINKSVFYHEYLHYLLRATSSFKYPTWYDEGMAEYYSTMKIEDNTVVLGESPKNARYFLDKGSISNIDSVFAQKGTWDMGSSQRVAEFYSTSWLMVHFFTLSKVNGFKDYRQELSNYLLSRNQGLEHEKAFDSAFPNGVVELKTDIRRYARKQRLNFATIPLPDVEHNFQSSEVSPAAMLNQFAIIANGIGNLEDGSEFHEKAMTLGNSEAFAHEALIQSEQGNAENAIKMIEQALSTNKITAEAYVDMARAYEYLAASDSVKYAPMQAKAISYYKIALNLKVLPETHWHYAEALWKANRKQEAINEIAALIKLMPANIYANLAAGYYMAELGNKPYAEYFLGNVLNWAEDPDLAKEALDILTKLNNASSKDE